MIKNIIFDFGDVFIDLDKPATAREMVRFGFEGLTPELDELFKQYEKGTVSSKEFLSITGAVFPKATEKDLINAWNAILLEFPLERLEFVENLSLEGQHRLFLLSNTNEIHIEHEKKKLGKRFDRFKKSFEKFYLSYEIGMRKPDTEIFEFVLNENQLIAEQTLFVDDTKENIETAASLGIKTWHLNVGLEDITALKKHL